MAEIIAKHCENMEILNIHKIQSPIDKAISLINPENELENRIISNSEWQYGVMQGKPRKGHPEGEIIYHILDVLKNVEVLCKTNQMSSEERRKLRIISLIHDSFKYLVDQDQPKTGENHHGMIARRFAEKILISEEEILEIIEHHDDAYNAWNAGMRKGKWDLAEKKIRHLLEILKQRKISLNLYQSFYWCDNTTGDKDISPYLWFQQKILDSLMSKESSTHFES